MTKTYWGLGLILVMLTSLTVSAQPPTLARVTIPFQFIVHEQNYPPGTYELRRLGDRGVRLVLPKSAEGVTLVSAQSIVASPKVRFSFRYVGSGYYLEEVIATGFTVRVRHPYVDTRVRAKAEIVSIEVRAGQ